jgi:hypothetical protein
MLQLPLSEEVEAIATRRIVHNIGHVLTLQANIIFNPCSENPRSEFLTSDLHASTDNLHTFTAYS